MGSSEESPSARNAEQAAANGKGVLKFLCSYGGNIMPRPGDARLRYVGGETRLLVVNRDIRFAELMKKVEDLSSASVKLKYQLPSEDLDVLVSVTCDEDVQHMIEEYDKFENTNKDNSLSSLPKLRAFLFPENFPLLSSEEPRSPTQKYIDMVNGRIAVPSRQTQPSSLRTIPDVSAFSDGSDSPASIKVSCGSSPAASPRFSPATYFEYKHSLSENANEIHNQMKRVPSEGVMANCFSPPKMSSYGQQQHQYQHQHPQLHNLHTHNMHRVRSTPNLAQHPQHYSGQMNRCNNHARPASATHVVRQAGSPSHNMFAGPYLSAASTRTASPLQHVYSFETFDR